MGLLFVMITILFTMQSYVFPLYHASVIPIFWYEIRIFSIFLLKKGRLDDDSRLFFSHYLLKGLYGESGRIPFCFSNCLIESEAV